MRRIKSIKTSTPNSLTHWFKVKSPLRVVFNFCCIQLSRYCPSLALKRWLLRRTGMKVEANVSIGLMAMFDVFFPEKITLKENCLIGYNCTILAHEFLIKEYRVGEVTVGKNALLGANSTVLPGIEIGSNAVIGAMSLVNKDVLPNSFAGGIPARELKKVNK